MAITGHPNVALKVTSPWRGKTKIWSLTYNISGGTPDLDTFFNLAQASWNLCFAMYISPASTGTFLSGYSLYDGQNSAALQEADYDDIAASDAAGWNGSDQFGGAYADDTSTLGVSGLEGCAVLFAPVGNSKTGKPVTMRKFIHACPAASGATDNLPALISPSPALLLGNGNLPGNRVLCSEKGGQGTWGALDYIGNHQLYRRYKKKVASPSVLTSLIDSGKSILISASAAAGE